jgi:hypothetical protein
LPRKITKTFETIDVQKTAVHSLTRPRVEPPSRYWNHPAARGI